MSIDQRLRNGLGRPGSDPAPDPDTLAALHRVEQRVHRRARRTRVGVGTLLVAVVALTIGGAAILRPDDPSDSEQVAMDASTTSAQQLAGTYVVDVAPSPARRRDGLAGRWVITLAQNGVLELRPPPDYAGVTLGVAYRVEGSRLRTDALVEPGCQADNGFVGTYEWVITGDAVTFTVVEDRCGARRALFTGQAWYRVP